MKETIFSFDDGLKATCSNCQSQEQEQGQGKDADGIFGSTSNPESSGLHGDQFRRAFMFGLLCGRNHQGPGVEK